jgi:hypothetical protein
MMDTILLFMVLMAFFLIGVCWGMLLMLGRVRMFGETPRYWSDLWRTLTTEWRWVAVLLVVMLSACHDPFPEQHAARCAGWMGEARTHSDSLNVTLACAQIAATHDAQRAAESAQMMSAAAMGMSSGSIASRK